MTKTKRSSIGWRTDDHSVSGLGHYYQTVVSRPGAVESLCGVRKTALGLQEEILGKCTKCERILAGRG